MRSQNQVKRDWGLKALQAGPRSWAKCSMDCRAVACVCTSDSEGTSSAVSQVFLLLSKPSTHWRPQAGVPHWLLKGFCCCQTSKARGSSCLSLPRPLTSQSSYPSTYISLWTSPISPQSRWSGVPLKVYPSCASGHLGTSPVAQILKNLPTMRETWVQSLGWEDPLKKGKATHSGILAWGNSMDCIIHGAAKSRTQLSSLVHFGSVSIYVKPISLCEISLAFHPHASPNPHHLHKWQEGCQW